MSNLTFYFVEEILWTVPYKEKQLFPFIHMYIQDFNFWGKYNIDGKLYTSLIFTCTLWTILINVKKFLVGHLWLIPVILATWEAEIGIIMVQS
jgi:hypothetical protein